MEQRLAFGFALFGAIGTIFTIIGFLLQYGSRMKWLADIFKNTKVILIFIAFSFILSSLAIYISFPRYALERPQNIRRANELEESLRPENIKATIGQWLSTFRLAFTPIEDINFDFQLAVNLLSGKRIYVGKTKQFPQYLTIQAIIVITQEYQKLLKKIPSNQVRRIVHDLAIEIDRLHLEGSRISFPQQIILEKKFPIANNLTEDVLIKAIDEMASTVDLIDQIILRDLEQ